MKRFVCVVFFDMMSLVAFCQKEKGEVIEGILDDKVFDRTIIQEISHALAAIYINKKLNYYANAHPHAYCQNSKTSASVYFR